MRGLRHSTPSGQILPSIATSLNSSARMSLFSNHMEAQPMAIAAQASARETRRLSNAGLAFGMAAFLAGRLSAMLRPAAVHSRAGLSCDSQKDGALQ